MEIVFNVETDGLPRDEIQHLMPEFSAPSNYKDAEKIQTWKARKQEEWFLDAPSSALSGRVMAIGIQKPNQTPLVIIDSDEADILRQFWNYYRSNADCKFVGFNIYAWAIPFLVRRSWANRVIVPKILNGRYLNGNFIDLLQVWGCGTFEKASLGNIARFFGIKRKDEEINFNAMWQISPSRAIEKLKSDVLSIRRIGEAMGVVREENSDEW